MAKTALPSPRRCRQPIHDGMAAEITEPLARGGELARAIAKVRPAWRAGADDYLSLSWIRHIPWSCPSIQWPSSRFSPGVRCSVAQPLLRAHVSLKCPEV